MTVKGLSPVRPDLLVPAAVGLWLVVFGCRHLIADLLLLPGAPTVESLKALEPVSPDEVSALVDVQGMALSVWDDAAGWSTLGLALALQSPAVPAAEQVALRERAVAALRRSVAMAPANPYVWARLAILRQADGATEAELIRYLRLSWLTGPNEERLRLPRLKIALGLWSALTASDRETAFGDIRNAWQEQPSALIDVALGDVAKSPFAINVVRAALLPTPPRLTAFEQALSTRPQSGY